jgi:hypothetical protein
MESSDIGKFQKVMAGVAENFSSKLTEAGTDLMFEVLRQYSFDQFYQATIQVLKTRKYTTMPTIADYVEAIDGNLYDRAEFQCSQVIRAVRECGRNKTPNFKDQITKSIVNNHYGWISICDKEKKELPWFERDFKQKYVAFKNIEAVKSIQMPERLKQLTEGIGKL